MTVTGQTDDAGAPVGPLVSFTVERLEGDKFVLLAELHPMVGVRTLKTIMKNAMPQLLSAARRNEQEAREQGEAR